MTRRHAIIVTAVCILQVQIIYFNYNSAQESASRTSKISASVSEAHLMKHTDSLQTKSTRKDENTKAKLGFTTRTSISKSKTVENIKQQASLPKPSAEKRPTTVPHKFRERTSKGEKYIRITQLSTPRPKIRAATTTPTVKPLKFEESLKRVRDAARDSIYRFDRSLNLPLLKLTEEQKNKTFRTRVARKRLKSQKLVIASAVRNAMNGLQKSLPVMKQLAELFHSVTVVFVENDSSDKTRTYLYNATKQSNDKFQVFLLGCGTVNSPDPCRINISYASSGRQHRPGHMEQVNRNLAEESIDRGFVMAALRNMYLQFIYDKVDADLLLVLESDLNWNKWDLDSVAQGLFHFKSTPRLDSLCAFTIAWNKIHDPCTLIFFHNKYFYVDAGKTDSPFIDRIGRTNQFFEMRLNIPHSKVEDVPKQPVKVASCFQGVAFYRMSSLRAASAFYRYSEGEWHCEHSTLSKQLKENYLDTQMQLSFGGQDAG